MLQPDVGRTHGRVRRRADASAPRDAHAVADGGTNHAEDAYADDTEPYGNPSADADGNRNPAPFRLTDA
jgi:hypothetical protein